MADTLAELRALADALPLTLSDAVPSADALGRLVLVADAHIDALIDADSENEDVTDASMVMDEDGETLVDGEVRADDDAVGEFCGDREVDAETDVVDETALLTLCFALREVEGVDETDDDSRALEDAERESAPERVGSAELVVESDGRTVLETVRLAVPHFEASAVADAHGVAEILPVVEGETVSD